MIHEKSEKTDFQLSFLFSLSFLSFNVAFCLFLSVVEVVASSSTEAIVVVVYY